ncbi:MAG: sialidase family protein [Candidatus Dormibacteria bacterium]
MTTSRWGLAAAAIAAISALTASWSTLAATVTVQVGPNTLANNRAPGQLVQDFKSPSLAVNPNDPANLVVAFRNDAPDFGCQPSYTIDGGRTWTASIFPPPRRGSCWAPAVAFGDTDHVYIAAQDRKGTPPGPRCTDVSVWASADGGRTFGNPTLIPQSNIGNVTCPFSVQAGIAVDLTQKKNTSGPRIYVTWYAFPNFASNRVYLTHSDDGGATWSDPLSNPVATENQFAETPTVAPDGTVYVVYKDADSATGCFAVGFGPFGPSTCPIRVLRSSDGGASFDSANSTMAGFEVANAAYDDLTAGEAPGIAVAPSGEIFVTFASLADLPTPNGCVRSLQAYIARSSDRGRTWTKQRLNDDPCSGGAAHRDPWVSVAPNGRVDAIFYDTRNDLDRVLTDAYFTTSSDNGSTFATNRRVSDRKLRSDSAAEPQSAQFRLQRVRREQRRGLNR